MRKEEKNPLYKHMEGHHPEMGTDCFSMIVLEKHRKPMERQMSEAIMIERGDCDIPHELKI